MAKLLFKKFIFCSLGMAFILVLNAPTGWGQVTPAEKEGLRLKILGDRYLSERDTSSAIATYQKALQKIPQSSATYFNLAIAFYTKKNIRGAATALEEVLKLTPQDAEAHYNLACLRIYQHKLNQAKLHFEQAKRYSRQDLPFFPSIQQGLEFLNEIQKYDFKTRALTLFHAQGEQEINSIPVLLS